MREKRKSHRKFWIIGIILLVIIALAVTIALNMPKGQNVSDSAFDLSAISDGVYQGECENGLVAVTVEVEVENHSITNVDILRHQNGLGKDAEVIVDEVVKEQSVEVDAISGATMSSETILKAIENALSAKEEK